MEANERKWRAIVLVDADRMGTAAAAERSGVAAKTITKWRRDLVDDTELAAAYTDETIEAIDAYRADLSQTFSQALAKLRTMIDQTEIGDLAQLLEVVREVGSLCVTGDALLAKKKKRDAPLGVPR